MSQYPAAASGLEVTWKGFNGLFEINFCYDALDMMIGE